MDLPRSQDGVVSRRQLIAAGQQPHDIRRALRRRELAAIHPGVYVNHTGEPTWIQHAWAALLVASSEADVSDAALCHRSAIRVAEGPGRRSVDEYPIHVVVRHPRKVHAPHGVRLHRCEHFDTRIAPARLPPRVRYEEAILDVASQSSKMDSAALLADAVGHRRTTAHRLLASLEERSYISERRWLEGVLADVADGTHSVLEHGFAARVVRPHGLPVPQHQQREETAIGVVYRDAAYGDVLVELDGRLFHSSVRQRNLDLDRDLVAAASGRRTVRLGWGQVFERPCATAAVLNQLVAGSKGRACGPACVLG